MMAKHNCAYRRHIAWPPMTPTTPQVSHVQIFLMLNLLLRIMHSGLAIWPNWKVTIHKHNRKLIMDIAHPLTKWLKKHWCFLTMKGIGKPSRLIHKPRGSFLNHVCFEKVKTITFLDEIKGNVLRIFFVFVFKDRKSRSFKHPVL